MNAVQADWGGQLAPNTYGTDAFITKFTAAGPIVYSTYLGKKHNDEADSIAADAAGNAYVTGWTASDRFRTVHALPGTDCGGASGFLAEIAPAGRRLIRSTCLSRRGYDFVTYVVRGAGGSLYIASDESNDRGQRGLFRLTHNRLVPTGTIPKGFAVQSMVAGPAQSILIASWVPQPDHWQCGFDDGAHVCTDGAVLALALAGAVRCSVTLGGSADDEVHAVAASGQFLLVTGMTLSTDFPVRQPIQATNGGAQYENGPVDAFLAQVDPTGPATRRSAGGSCS